MKYMVMALGTALFGLGFAVVSNTPALAAFMIPCAMFAGTILYLEVKGEFDE